MKAAVTGGTGFFGRVLLRYLQDAGADTRALYRNAADADGLRAIGATPVLGDLARDDGCAGLVTPGAIVFHAAARVDMTGTWEQFEETTVHGTRRLLDAALPQKPTRFVYVSSAGVYSPAHASGPLSADRTPAAPTRNNFYGRAKLAAETLVRERCDAAGCPWVIMRLGFLYGPGNRALLRHVVPMLAQGKLVIIGNGRNRIATSYVDDSARAVLLAGTHPDAPGQIFDVASAEPVTQEQYWNATADAVGQPRPGRKVPYGVAYAFVTVAEWIGGLIGRPPPFNRGMVKLMSVDQVLDASRLERELGWRSEVGFAEGMARTKAWHQAEDSHAGG
jgi:nucleoside-diphosphate-sugar epimerase